MGGGSGRGGRVGGWESGVDFFNNIGFRPTFFFINPPADVLTSHTKVLPMFFRVDVVTLLLWQRFILPGP